MECFTNDTYSHVVFGVKTTYIHLSFFENIEFPQNFVSSVTNGIPRPAPSSQLGFAWYRLIRLKTTYIHTSFFWGLNGTGLHVVLEIPTNLIFIYIYIWIKINWYIKPKFQSGRNIFSNRSWWCYVVGWTKTAHIYIYI